MAKPVCPRCRQPYGAACVYFIGDEIVCQKCVDLLHAAPPNEAKVEAMTLPPPGQVLDLCRRLGWSMHWAARGCYLHLEASEFVEALRGKHGSPVEEAADVLFVLVSMIESAKISWEDVLTQLSMKMAKLDAKAQASFTCPECGHGFSQHHKSCSQGDGTCSCFACSES